MPEVIRQKLIDSEESYLNTTFWDIHPLFRMVQNGDREQLQERLHFQFENFPAGRISRDARKQLEYLTVSLVNTFMIAAIQGGVYPPDANAAADQALRRLCQIRAVDEIPAIVRETAVRLCGMVRQAKQQDTGNSHVEKAKHFISTHLTQEIRMEDVAADAGVSPYHLSRLFKTHTGKTMRDYLNHERIEAAKELLAVSDHGIPEIASLLRFCDQSYFTLVFRRETGMTPGQYRKENHRNKQAPHSSVLVAFIFI